MNFQVDPTSSNLASAMLNLKIRPRAVVGYGVKIFHPSPPNYVTRSPGCLWGIFPGAACLGVFFATELQILKLGYCQARVFLSFSPDLTLKYSYDYS